MGSAVARQMVLVAGLLSVPVMTSVDEPKTAPPDTGVDERLLKLERFFEDRNYPVRPLAAEFLRAADEHNLDWRLLPSISVVESSGGKAYRNNNIFGWDSCRERFPSVRAGIHIVASRLANSNLYRDKDVDEILATYNPNPAYPARVKTVMRMIASAQSVPEARLN